MMSQDDAVLIVRKAMLVNALIHRTPHQAYCHVRPNKYDSIWLSNLTACLVQFRSRRSLYIQMRDVAESSRECEMG